MEKSMNGADLEKEEIKQTIPLQYYYLVPLVIIILFITAFFVVIFQTITFFRLRNICCLYITRPFCKIILWLWGVTYKVHYQSTQESKQKIYVINHTSRIDTVLLPAICLDNARYFMSKRTYKYIPITIINIFIGTFLIDQQDKPEKRTECFKRAEATLRKTGESVILSPEGTIITAGKIEKFNKGAFHLATNMKVPIVPVYIYIPDEVNPGNDYSTSGGHVDVYVLPEIDTGKWILDDLIRNKEMVRDIFVEFHNRMHGVSYD